MSDEPLPQSEIILYQTEDGRTRIQSRFDHDTLWLTQALIAELFEKDVRTINEHLVNIFDERELAREATIRKFRIVRTEGKREVAREIEHYNLDAILAVGFRVRSHRGTQFRQWAIGRLNEYLVKGFTMDDERLKNPPGKGQIISAQELMGTGLLWKMRRKTGGYLSQSLSVPSRFAIPTLGARLADSALGPGGTVRRRRTWGVIQKLWTSTAL
jgi:hypothetical protein